MSDVPAVQTPTPPSVNQRWALTMALGFCGMAALGGWIWHDLDHRIEAAKQTEAETGKPVGPDRLKSPRAAAAEKHAQALAAPEGAR